MTNNDIVRLEILNRILSRMSEEDRRDYIIFMNDKNHNEIMTALSNQSKQLNRVVEKVEKQSWVSSFGSDVLANVTTNTAWWLFSKLFSSIKK